MLRFMKKKRKQKIHEETYEDNKLFFSSYEKDGNIIPQVTHAVVETVIRKKPRKGKIKKRDRRDPKNFWSNGYENWSDNDV